MAQTDPARHLADAELGRWVASVRDQPSGRLDLALLRRPRTRAPGPAVDSVHDCHAPGEPGVAVRIYRPGPAPRPIVVHVHGGGFVAGDLDSHDRVCRRIAIGADAVVVAVAHRSAPEHPGPAAVDDIATVVEWVKNRPAELGAVVGAPAVVGDSSGGAIAVLAAALLARRATALTALVLVCPNADLTLSCPSIESKGHGWGLEASALAWFVAQWAPNLDELSLRQLSPLHAELAGLPSTIVVTAEHDPLRDEGRALADRLQAQGISCVHMLMPGMVHGFWTLDDVSPAAHRAGDAVIDRLRGMLTRENVER